MLLNGLLMNTLESFCETIHEDRLMAVLETAEALQHSNDLSLTAIGRKLRGDVDIKHKVKKVYRIIGNKYLHNELGILYEGLSKFVFTYIAQADDLPIVIDLCFIKDDRAIQMLSAEATVKGRTIPLYREVFKEGESAGRATEFLSKLKKCLPEGRKVILILDAGFYEDWFRAIESLGWYWLGRIRKGKSLKLSEDAGWTPIADFIPTIKPKTIGYIGVLLTKRHEHPCRIVTTKRIHKKRKVKVSRGKTTSKLASGSYRSAAKEAWILATNLPLEYKAVNIVKLYEKKRMQIEESFREVKSTQFGLGGRNVRTHCIHRWGVKMLLAAIVQITCWVIGVIGHSQGFQRIFQANTVRDRKVFSYFTLGKLIIEHDKLDRINFDEKKLSDVIQQELVRDW